MFEDWKKRRKLKKELKSFEDAYAPDFRAAKTEDDHYAVQKVFENETADIVSKLKLMETFKLEQQAKKYGVAPPPHWLVTGEQAWWETDDYTKRTYLTDAGLAKIRHETKEAKLNYWKRWVEIVSPIVSVLISLLALALSIYVFYNQLSGVQH